MPTRSARTDERMSHVKKSEWSELFEIKGPRTKRSVYRYTKKVTRRRVRKMG